MTDADLPTFLIAFKALRMLYPLRADQAELGDIARIYFRALSRFRIEDVEAAATRWTERGTRFPKPAEWIEMLPRVGVRAYVAPLEPVEAAEHRQARAWHYDAAPCVCEGCTEAGVSHRFLRYVPDTDADDRDLLGLLDEKVVVRGHWAHGEELKRWYWSREAFLGLKATYEEQKRIARSMPKAARRLALVEAPLALEPAPDEDPVLVSEL